MDKPHRNLEVWSMSMELAQEIYTLTDSFPASEKFGIISQMRRSAVSIPSNIAEGAARGSAADYARFLTISLASLSELDTRLELSRRLAFCSSIQTESIEAKMGSVSRMLVSLRKRLRST